MTEQGEAWEVAAVLRAELDEAREHLAAANALARRRRDRLDEAGDDIAALKAERDAAEAERDDVRAELSAFRDILASLRVREQTYRSAWRNVSARAEAYGHEVHSLRRALRRKTRVAAIGFKWAREYREARDAALGLVDKANELRSTAVDRMTRLAKTANQLAAERDRWRDRCANRTAERDAARRDAQEARNTLGQALRERDALRREGNEHA